MPKHSKPRAPNVTLDTLVAFLDIITANPVLSDACRCLGYADNTVFSWLAKSKQGDAAFAIRGWPHEEAPGMQFCDAVVLAMRMHTMHLRNRIMRDVDIGVPRVLRTPQGDIVWRKSAKLLADWGGESPEAKEDAERIGGVRDYPFEHDESGKRIAEVVYDPAPAALRVHATRALLPGWNVAEKSERDVRVQGGVMIVGATAAPNAPPPALPDYSKPTSPLQADLIARMRAGPKHPVPDGHVLDAVGRPVGSGPANDQADDVQRDPRSGSREPQRVR